MLDKPNVRIYIRLNKIKHAPDAGKSGGLIRQRNRDERAGKTKILIPPHQCRLRGIGGNMEKKLINGRVEAICTHYGCGCVMERTIVRNDSDTNDLAVYTCPVCGWVEEENWE